MEVISNIYKFVKETSGGVLLVLVFLFHLYLCIYGLSSVPFYEVLISEQAFQWYKFLHFFAIALFCMFSYFFIDKKIGRRQRLLFALLSIDYFTSLMLFLQDNPDNYTIAFYSGFFWHLLFWVCFCFAWPFARIDWEVYLEEDSDTITFSRKIKLLQNCLFALTIFLCGLVILAI